MDESEFNHLADQWLTMALDALEEADTQQQLDIEHDGGMLTIMTTSGKTLLVSKHTPSRQLWLSSPISGGLHFNYVSGTKEWALADGRSLDAILSAELATLANMKVVF